jgi:hypothetical protein
LSDIPPPVTFDIDALHDSTSLTTEEVAARDAARHKEGERLMTKTKGSDGQSTASSPYRFSTLIPLSYRYLIA